MTQFDVSTSAKANRAKERLEARFRIGIEEAMELEQRVAKMHIWDRYVHPKDMTFILPEREARLTYVASSSRPETEVTIHPHALGQLCTKAGFPVKFAHRLVRGEGWEKSLFCTNMNELFHRPVFLNRKKRPAKFLHRLVDNELRGFLTQSFNRQLASRPLLRGFSEACQEVGAIPIQANTSSVHFSLKCYLPHVFEPVEGEFIAFGVMWANSDFGSGRLRVAMSTMRISSGTLGVFEDEHHRRHIGSVVEDDDDGIEISDEAAKAEVKAQVLAIKDAVVKLLSPDSVNTLLKAMATAAEEKVPWNRLKYELGRILRQQEVKNLKELLDSNSHDIIDLPPPGRTDDGEPIATRWWASSAVGWLSSKEMDPERKEKLQTLAGGLLHVG
jgi:hypothetical protein